MKKGLFITFLILIVSINASAQLKFGTDLYSRYIWRGINLGGESPAFQPSLTYTIAGFSVGAWGSYSFPGSQNPYSENDLIATYTAGPVLICFTDYYIPSAGIPFGHYKPKTGVSAAHTLEGGLCYTGPDKFPVSLQVFYNLANDPDNSAYIQLGYPFTIGDATLTPSVGGVPSKSAYYGTSKGNVINVGITAAKSIVITDKFSLPINVSYINNPSQDISYLVFGLSITL